MEEFGRDSLEHLETGHALKNLPFKLRMKNGEIKHVVVDSSACYNADGSFNHTRCYVRDDQERIVQTAVLNERMDKYRLMSAEKDRFIRITFHQIRTPLHALAASLATATAQHLKNSGSFVLPSREKGDSGDSSSQVLSLSVREIEELKLQVRTVAVVIYIC